MTDPFIYSVVTLIASVDEVGAVLVGAAVTAAVILYLIRQVVGLADSKLSERRHATLHEDITRRVLARSMSRAEAYEIDQINIFRPHCW